MSYIKKTELRVNTFFALIALIFCVTTNNTLADDNVDNVITTQAYVINGATDESVIGSKAVDENTSQEVPVVIFHEPGAAINPYFDPNNEASNVKENASEALSIQAAGVSNQSDGVAVESQAETVIYFTSDNVEVKNSSTNFIFQNKTPNSTNALVSTGEIAETTSLPNLQERQAQVEAIRQSVLGAK